MQACLQVAIACHKIHLYLVSRETPKIKHARTWHSSSICEIPTTQSMNFDHLWTNLKIQILTYVPNMIICRSP